MNYELWTMNYDWLMICESLACMSLLSCFSSWAECPMNCRFGILIVFFFVSAKALNNWACWLMVRFLLLFLVLPFLSFDWAPDSSANFAQKNFRIFGVMVIFPPWLCIWAYFSLVPIFIVVFVEEFAMLIILTLLFSVPVLDNAFLPFVGFHVCVELSTKFCSTKRCL